MLTFAFQNEGNIFQWQLLPQGVKYSGDKDSLSCLVKATVFPDIRDQCSSKGCSRFPAENAQTHGASFPWNSHAERAGWICCWWCYSCPCSSVPLMSALSSVGPSAQGRRYLFFITAASSQGTVWGFCSLFCCNKPGRTCHKSVTYLVFVFEVIRVS